MDRIVSVVGYTDKELGIHQVVGCLPDVVDVDRIHVVNYDLAVNLITLHCQIHSVIPHDHIVAYTLPFGRSVELLIEISLEAERLFSNFATELKVVEPFLESVQEDELRI